jgi:uroporphyrinogen decarboxylase
MIAVTIFNTYATGQKLSNRHLPELIAADRAAAAEGLATVAGNLASFAGAVIAAGADGVFLAADGCGDGVFEAGVYREVFRPGDLTILEGASSGKFNIVHIHGMDTDFDNFVDYPAQVINWADRTAGPSIEEARGKLDRCLLAGVDHLGTIATGSSDEIRGEVADAIGRSGGRKFIVGPGCSVPNDIDHARLRVMREAVEETSQPSI